MITAQRRQQLAHAGERIALEHYERRGFRALARNYRTPAGELDLIVYGSRTIVFVEVKTRRSRAPDPLESITALKQRRLRRLAAGWLAAQHRIPPADELRFDAVGVVIDAKGQLVELDQREAVM